MQQKTSQSTNSISDTRRKLNEKLRTTQSHLESFRNTAQHLGEQRSVEGEESNQYSLRSLWIHTHSWRTQHPQQQCA